VYLPRIADKFLEERLDAKLSGNY